MDFLFSLLILVIVLGLIYWIITLPALASAIQAGGARNRDCGLPSVPAGNSVRRGGAIPGIPRALSVLRVR